MGQTPGGSSGDLELLKRIEHTEQQVAEVLKQIEGIVNRKIASIQPSVSNVSLYGGCKNDSVILPPYCQYRTGDDLPTITVNGKTFYIWGKADNANPFGLKPMLLISAGGLSMAKKNNVFAITNTPSIVLYYDGVNTYICTSISPKSLASVEYDLVMIIAHEPILYNSQS